ncbi:hypothetical protein GGS26DRAFT_38537 [Hypomontagnella submonticulosa]|nr:hypothetical protein GGS26DRAFT_38537 [Hypomontagnella submonticulosa]
MASSLSYRAVAIPLSYLRYKPLAGALTGLILCFVACSILSYFLAQRILEVKIWRRLPPSAWLVFAIYAISWVFVFATGIINYGIGINSSRGVCSAAIQLFLFCYLVMKLIYTFFTEKALFENQIIDFSAAIYGIICILSSVYHIAHVNNEGCILGIQRLALVPLLIFEIVANVYLAIVFLSPLRNIYLSQGPSPGPPNPPRLHSVAIRAFIGVLGTTTSTVVNLTVLLALNGELGWVYLTSCNADALFTVLVIHWATSRDNAEAIGFPCSSPSFTSRDKHCSCHPPAPLPTSAQRRGQKPAISRPLNTTSTSQYEHIFGDLEPETETEVVTASNISATASKTIPESSDGIDDENAPTTDLGLEEENEIHGNETAGIWASPRTLTHMGMGAEGIAQAQAQAHPSSPGKSRDSSVSGAVAVDLERIRRYRGRRQQWSVSARTPTPTPSSSSVSGSGSTRPPRPPHAYYISRLAFEGDGASQWHDLVEAEKGEQSGSRIGGGEDEDDKAGWI